MRDLVFAEDVLLGLGYGSTVRRHFERFIALQREDGRIPNVVNSGWRRAFNPPFHFWTCDSNILFIVGMRKYVEAAHDDAFWEQSRSAADRSEAYVRSSLNDHGLIPGMDWRDSIPNYRDKCLLSNQTFLVQMYDCLGRKGEADSVRARINELFRSPDKEFYADFVHWDGKTLEKDFHLDCLGNPLAVLNDVAPPDFGSRVLAALEEARTPFGYRNIFPSRKIERLIDWSPTKTANAFVRNGAIFRDRPDTYQNSTIWPFVEGRVVSAFLRLGMKDEARRTYEKMLGRDDTSEWYSPVTGEIGGSRDQLWTACAIVSSSEALAAT